MIILHHAQIWHTIENYLLIGGLLKNEHEKLAKSSTTQHDGSWRILNYEKPVLVKFKMANSAQSLHDYIAIIHLQIVQF